MLAFKLGPALACGRRTHDFVLFGVMPSAWSVGNVVILKPAEETPLTALYCGTLIKEVLAILSFPYYRVFYDGHCRLAFRRVLLILFQVTDRRLVLIEA